MLKILLQLCLIYLVESVREEDQQSVVLKRSTDSSIHGYMTERTCWSNEVCKEEFQSTFRCKCPDWSFCRAPGRYYNAFCSMANTGYIWAQPDIREKTRN